MQVIGLLSFYDEDPLALLQNVNDLAKIGVTNLIAVHGRYEHFPEQPVLRSMLSEIGALTERCLYHKIGLALDLSTPVWKGDEVAKRERLLELAHVVADGEPAWICIWDCDYRLEDGAPLVSLNGAKSYDVLLTDNPDEQNTSDAEWYRVKLLMQLEPRMQMGSNHYTYLYPGGEHRIIPRDETPPAPLSGLRVRHLKYRRPQHRLDAQAAYYAVRDGEGLESAA